MHEGVILVQMHRAVTAEAFTVHNWLSRDVRRVWNMYLALL